jgi:hypothetical protein
MARTSVKKADIRALSNAPVATSSSSSRKTANYNAAETTLGIATAAAAVGYTYSDWESDAPATPYNQGGDETDGQETDVDDEEEERARREFIDALKRSAPPDPTSTSAVSSTTNGGGNNNNDGEDGDDEYETKSEVRSEKERREDAVRQLSVEADRLRRQTHVAVDVGRIYNDGEGGVMEEAERTLAALTAAPDALEVLAEMNKKKELRSVDHESVDYLPVRKNLYIVPRSLASLTPTEVAERRARLGVKVRGKGAPAPLSKFGEAELSDRI